MKRLLIFTTITFLTLCIVTGIYFYRLYQEKKASSFVGIPIQIIVQTGPEKEALKTDYLAELLNLSYDGPPVMIEEKKAEAQLLESPLIKRAKIKCISPGILFIDYSLRKPCLFFGDFENVALDYEGYPFPFSPFYTPKNMPQIFLGENKLQWGIPVKQKDLVFEIVGYLEKKIDFFTVKSLDLRQIEHPSLGRREIVLVLQREKDLHYLRLNPLSYQKEISRYLMLTFPEGDQIIDLRLPKLAFIKGKKDG